MNPLISFLVVSFNSEKYITDCLNSILRQSEKNYDIIVIDNNSTDKTVSILQEFKKYSQVKIIFNTTNIGYGNALSIGINESKAEYLAILNADVLLDERWVSSLLTVFSNDDEIMAVNGKILLPNGDVQSTGGMMDRYGAVIQRDGKLFKTSKIPDGTTFFYSDGSSFMIRRKIFNQIHFDSKLFLYYEDVDLSWKIRMLNYKIAYSEKAISYHHVGHSNSDMTLSKFYYIARNRIYVCLKNYSSKNVLTRIPVILFLIFLDSVYYERSKKRTGYIKTFFRALWWNLVNLKYAAREHRKLSSINKISDSELDKYVLNHSIELGELVAMIKNSQTFKYSQLVKLRNSDLPISERMKKDWDDRAKLDSKFFIRAVFNQKDSEFWESGKIECDTILGINTPRYDLIFGGRDPKEMKVLEIGCGIGRILIPMTTIFGEVVGIDVSKEMIRVAESYIKVIKNCKVFENNGSDLSMFPNNYFDFCYSFIVFQHIPKKEIVQNYINEVSRVLKNGGLFRFQVHGDFDQNPVDDTTWNGVHFTSEEMHKIALENKFEILEEHGQNDRYYWLTFKSIKNQIKN